jgi:Family of unknown function (DUF5995)
MSTSPMSSDQAVLQILLGSQVAAIADVIAVMQAIDQLLPQNDGLKWFNLLYLKVTQEIDGQSPANVWRDPAWLTHLDVVFAGWYFRALTGWLQGSDDVPGSWRALLESRFAANIDRIQFALAGMNAHINHDLAQALLQTDADLNLVPLKGGPEHSDYEQVNGILEAVLPDALTFLATGILGLAAQDTGKIGRLLAIWNVRKARDLAWDFAGYVRSLPGLSRGLALAAQDQMTGVLGRSLLLPVDPAPAVA